MTNINKWKKIIDRKEISLGEITVHIKEKGIIFIVATCIAFFATLSIVNNVEAAQSYRSTQKSLANEVVRFHVLANSDEEQDQELKLKVKDEVVSYMKKSLGSQDDVVTTKIWIENHIKEIETICQEVIKEEGYDYSLTVQLELCDFPTKTYGDVTFPAGEYEALRIQIGQAKGENWWCCLYPNLCFIDATTAVVSKEGKEELEGVLTEDEYDIITTKTEFKFKWFFF